MKAIFENETEITDSSFKRMMLCKKFCERRLEYIIKGLMCFSIFILIWFVDFKLIDKIFCCMMAFLGIVDIFEIKEKRIKSVSTLKYDFFGDKIQVFNGETKMDVDYLEIERIIKTRRYYFLKVGQYALVLDIKGFKVGNSKELIEFIIEKVKEREKMIRSEM